MSIKQAILIFFLKGIGLKYFFFPSFLTFAFIYIHLYRFTISLNNLVFPRKIFQKKIRAGKQKKETGSVAAFK